MLAFLLQALAWRTPAGGEPWRRAGVHIGLGFEAQKILWWTRMGAGAMSGLPRGHLELEEEGLKKEEA